MDLSKAISRKITFACIICVIICVPILLPTFSSADPQSLVTFELVEYYWIPRKGTITIYFDPDIQGPYGYSLSALAEINAICTSTIYNFGGKCDGWLGYYDNDINLIRAFHPSASYLYFFPCGSGWEDGSTAERWSCPGGTILPEFVGVAAFLFDECWPVRDENGRTIKYQCGDLLYWSEDLGQQWYYMYSGEKLW